MKLLALDTSTSYLSLALALGEDIVCFHERVEQKHAERALPEIARLLENRQVKLNTLDAIVFGQGPGSFTGLRIGCGLAQGLAFAAGLPVIAIPTLDNLAYQAGTGRVQVCLDARMQQVYYASYQTGASWQRLGPIRVGNPDEIKLDTEATLAAGDGFAAYPALLNQRSKPFAQVLDQLTPHARAQVELARSGRYPQMHPREAELLYIRDKVALTAIEQQRAREK